VLYEHQFLSETRLSGPCVCAGTSTHECALQTLGFQFISSLFPERAPAGQEVLLAYYGGAQNSRVEELAQVSLNTVGFRSPSHPLPLPRHMLFSRFFGKYSLHDARV
jgi:hypothetical protein